MMPNEIRIRKNYAFNMKYMPTDFPVCTLYKLVGSRKNQQHCSIWLI